MFNRTEAREYMMQVYFEMEACSDFDVNNRQMHMKKDSLGGQKNYCNEMFSLICNKKEDVDNLISKYSKKWTTARMPKADLAILRVAVSEIAFMSGIPAAVSANEAVELAKKYGTEESSGYVNAILGGIIRNEEVCKNE